MTELTQERYELAIGRISQIPEETAAGEKFRPYFRRTAEFLLLLDAFYDCVVSGRYRILSWRSCRTGTAGFTATSCRVRTGRATRIRRMRPAASAGSTGRS